MNPDGLRVKEPDPVESQDYSTIERKLREGAKLHAFLSGGGLRVVRLEKEGPPSYEREDPNLLGYGEHPHLNGALAYCEEDTKAGGRKYDEVYGKLHDHYLTGSSSPNSELDAWIRRGRSFDVTATMVAKDASFTAVLSGYQDNEAPTGYQERVLKGETLEYTSRGYTYRMVLDHFPGNGEPCVSTSIVKTPKGKTNGADPWMWPITQTATGGTLLEALFAALKAPPVEVPRR